VIFCFPPPLLGDNPVGVGEPFIGIRGNSRLQ